MTVPKASSKRRSIQASNLTDELSTADERHSNQFGYANYGRLGLERQNSVAFGSAVYAFDLWETGLYERVSLAQIHFLLFLHDTSPAYGISL